MVCQIISYAKYVCHKTNFGFSTVYPIDHLKGKTYIVFVGRMPGVYNTCEEADAQVHQYSGVDHKAFKHKMEAEVAFMKFWQIDGGNAQQGS